MRLLGLARIRRASQRGDASDSSGQIGAVSEALPVRLGLTDFLFFTRTALFCVRLVYKTREAKEQLFMRRFVTPGHGYCDLFLLQATTRRCDRLRAKLKSCGSGLSRNRR